MQKQIWALLFAVASFVISLVSAASALLQFNLSRQQLLTSARPSLEIGIFFSFGTSARKDTYASLQIKNSGLGYAIIRSREIKVRNVALDEAVMRGDYRDKQISVDFNWNKIAPEQTINMVTTWDDNLDVVNAAWVDIDYCSIYKECFHLCYHSGILCGNSQQSYVLFFQPLETQFSYMPAGAKITVNRD